MVKLPSADDVHGWLQALKTDKGRHQFIDSGLDDALLSLQGAAEARRTDVLIPLLRLLRNTVPLGEKAVGSILRAGAAQVVSRLVQLYTPPQPHAKQTPQLLDPDRRSEVPLTATSDVVPDASQLQGREEDLVALLAACAQLLANLSASGLAAAQAVWARCYPHALSRLVGHPEARVHDAAALALYNCCRQDARCSAELAGHVLHAHPPAEGGAGASAGASLPASAGAGASGGAADEAPGSEEPDREAPSRAHARAMWVAILDRLVRKEESSASVSADAPPQPEWQLLLCGCVALRQGLLAPLLRLLGRPAPAAASAAAADGSGAEPLRYSRHAAVLLHALALELAEMRGAAPVGLLPDGHGADMGAGCAAGGEAGAVDGVSAEALLALPGAARPLAAAMAHAVEVAAGAARRCCGEGAGGGGGGAGEEGGTGSGEVAPAAAVLEAALELLKAAAQREDGCRAIAGGTDLVAWLLLPPPPPAAGATAPSPSPQDAGASGRHSGAQGEGVAGADAPGAAPADDATRAGGCGPALRLLLGMLAALQPAALTRQQERAAAVRAGRAPAPPPSPFFDEPSAAAAPPPAPADRPVVVLPPVLTAMAAGYPELAPYVGYRGDLVAVLANGAYGRPAVARQLVAVGGLELLLAQTHLDERAPLAREWALWGVRNMCEGSEEVRSRIAGLEVAGAVDTPELRRLGLRVELDKTSGKMKVTKTEEAEAALEKAKQGKPPSA